MERYRKILLLAVKIGVGSSIAVFLARALHLEYAVSAGTVTLLTLMTSRLETMRLIAARLVTFAATLLVSWFFDTHIDSIWISYGLALMVVVFMAEALGWRATISVNAVVVAHFLTDEKFNAAAILNELQLVLIGVVLALVLNLFYGNSRYKKKVISDMRTVERRLQALLRDLASYLAGEDPGRSVWDEICQLKADIEGYMKSADDYQSNTFQSDPEYYVDYFKMRWRQCSILRNVYHELEHIRNFPAQASIISDYLLYLSDYMLELNIPARQIERLHELIAEVKSQELPKSEEEFENRAMLFHILMDIDDFLGFKADFVSSLSPSQREQYCQSAPQTEEVAV